MPGNVLYDSPSLEVEPSSTFLFLPQGPAPEMLLFTPEPRSFFVHPTGRHTPAFHEVYLMKRILYVRTSKTNFKLGGFE